MRKQCFMNFLYPMVHRHVRIIDGLLGFLSISSDHALLNNCKSVSERSVYGPRCFTEALWRVQFVLGGESCFLVGAADKTGNQKGRHVKRVRLLEITRFCGRGRGYVAISRDFCAREANWRAIRALQRVLDPWFECNDVVEGTCVINIIDIIGYKGSFLSNF